jgi:hypothetical protein
MLLWNKKNIFLKISKNLTYLQKKNISLKYKLIFKFMNHILYQS